MNVNKTIKLKLTVIKNGGIGLFILNFLVKMIFRINKQAKFNIHFTSRIIGNNLYHYNDRNTLLSFKNSSNCYIQSINGIKIGKNFLFASGLKLISANHSTQSSKRESIVTTPIKIGDNCWFGANVIILPGVEIGNNCIVGAGSVVTKNFKDDNLIIAGNPAKIIRKNNA